MKNLNQKELVQKLMNAANLIENNRIGKASYITLTEEQIKNYASLWGVCEDEAIEIIQNHLKFEKKNEK